MNAGASIFSLRDAVETDIPFLRDLRRITMLPVVTAHYPWVDEEQNRRALANLASARIIMRDGRAIGVVKAVLADREMHLSQIQILPEHQNQGIGSAIIRQLQEECRRESIPLTLSVSGSQLHRPVRPLTASGAYGAGR